MKWVKKGLILDLDGRHAQMPVVDQYNDGTMEVYFSTRDEQGRSMPMSIVTRQDRPADIISQHPPTAKCLGRPGTFDDNGVMPSWIVAGSEKVYYVGWSKRTSVPYATAIGLAELQDDGSLRRYREGPVIGCGPDEPYGCTTPCVILDNGIFRMWYASFILWTDYNEPWYHIRYKESRDSIRWDTMPVPQYLFHDYACTCRPSVFIRDNRYYMIYSRRGLKDYRTDKSESYRLCLATSDDGVEWDDEEVGIDVSESGWDSEMIAYGTVYEFDGKVYMLYNGNGFGKSGIGYAILEDEG